MQKVIDSIRNDDNYYGKMGKEYLSNSDIDALMNNPKNFGKDKPDGKSLAEGRYFHQLLLEPNKAAETIFVSCANRNTNIYKQYLEDAKTDFAMLQSEGEFIRWLSSTMKGNMIFFDEIYKDGNKFEEPMIGEIMGLMWKGKADIVTDEYVIDLKTTSDIKKFKWSAREYNYDSQCYIYQELFGKPLLFYVIDKTTGSLGIFRPTDAFVQRGKEKVERAIEMYTKYFGPNPPESLLDYYIDEVLE